MQEKHKLLVKLHPVLSAPLHPTDFAAEMAAASQLTLPPPQAPAEVPAAAASERSETGSIARQSTLCTVREPSGRDVLRGDRPGLVVSSTSWTPDEDFGLLLKAAQLYDAKVGHIPAGPLCRISGMRDNGTGASTRVHTLVMGRFWACLQHGLHVVLALWVRRHPSAESVAGQ